MPPDNRRWLRISLRTVHIAALAVVVGGAVLGAEAARVDPWLAATVASGTLLLATEMGSEEPFFRELRGLAMVLKLVLLVVAAAWAPGRIALLFVVLALSSVVSHMPGRWRHWSPWDATE